MTRLYCAFGGDPIGSRALVHLAYPHFLISYVYRESMKAYSVAGTGPPHDRAIADDQYPNVLISHEYKDATRLRGYRPQSLMLDSGAFSVWKSGRTVDIDEYAAWALTMRADSPTAVVINLDAIPGKPNRPPSRAERERAQAESLENADYLRGKGLPVMEVFHLYEDPAFLDQLMERRQPGEVLGIGGTVGAPAPTKAAFLRAVWSHVLAHHARRADHTTRVPPLHALGVGVDSSIIHEHPWYSADSSTYIIARRFNKRVTRDRKQVWMPEHHRNNKSAQLVEVHNVLRTYRRLERDLTAMWQRRRVGFIDTPEDEHAHEEGPAAASR